MWFRPVGNSASGRDSSGSRGGNTWGSAAFHPAQRLAPMGLPGALQTAGDNAIVAKAREFMANPPYNGNNGTHDWTGWCLGFVYTTMKAATGRDDPQMGRASAKDAYFAMAQAGRINNNVASIPAGAAVLWGYLGQYGHAAISTGVIAPDGSPMIITTSHSGIIEISLKAFGAGNPTGWGMWVKE